MTITASESKNGSHCDFNTKMRLNQYPTAASRRNTTAPKECIPDDASAIEAIDFVSMAGAGTVGAKLGSVKSSVDWDSFSFVSKGMVTLFGLTRGSFGGAAYDWPFALICLTELDGERALAFLAAFGFAFGLDGFVLGFVLADFLAFLAMRTSFHIFCNDGYLKIMLTLDRKSVV